MSPDIFLDDVAADADYRIADDEPNLVVEHIPSGRLFRHNESASQWELVGDLDLGGGNLSSVGSLGADKVNRVVSVKPGQNLQSRFDAAPSGGKVVFKAGVHDVAEMGTAVVEKPVDVEMPGGLQGNNNEGAFLVNSGADTVDSPVIEFRNATVGTFSSRPRYSNHTLNIYHEGATSPAVRYNEYSETDLTPRIDLGGVGQDGVEILGGSFLFKLSGGFVRRHTRYGVYEHAEGGSYMGVQTNIVGSQGGTATSHLHIEHPWVWVGGQFGGGSGIGVEVLSSNSRFYGPRIEGPTMGIKFGETGTKAVENKVLNPYMVSISDVCAEFQNSTSNKIDDPVRLINGSTSGMAVRWAADSGKDVVSGSFEELSTKSWDIAAGAYLPTVQFDPLPVIDDASRGNITQPVEGMRLYNQADTNLNIYTGAGWILPGGTAT